MLSRFKPLLGGCSVAALILASAGVAAQTEYDPTVTDKAQHGADVAKNEISGKEELSGPQEDVQESAEVLKQLKQDDPELANKLAEAKGVFIIPDYATASLLVGGSGGEGVLFDRRQGGEWTNPGFYDVGNIDVGVQAGAAAGSIVMLLMTDQAVQNFETDTEFSLTAEAGLTIVNWSALAPSSTEEGDVLVWSDTEGLLAEASVGVGGISWDEEESSEYYGQDVKAEQVLAGDVQNPHEDVLQSEFAEFTTEQPLESTMPEEPSTDQEEWSTEDQQ